jgi:hypothetical protein
MRRIFSRFMDAPVAVNHQSTGPPVHRSHRPLLLPVPPATVTTGATGPPATGTTGPPATSVTDPPVHRYTVERWTGRVVLQYDSMELSRTPSRLPTVLSKAHLRLFKRAIWNSSRSTRSTIGDPVIATYGRHLTASL